MDINIVSIIGRLTKDPELRYTQAGIPVCVCSVANNRTYVSNGEKKGYTNYFDVVTWQRLAESVAKYTKKGDRVGVAGRLEFKRWDDQDGKTHSKIQIVAEQFEFLQPKRDGETPDAAPDTHGENKKNNTAPDEEAAAVGAGLFNDDEVPF